MSRPQKRLYTVYYTDGTYLSYEFTQKEYDAVSEGLIVGECAVSVAIGTLVLADVRSIILQKSVKKPVENKAAEPDMSQEEKDWIHAQKVAERVIAEESEIEQEDDDVDYIGGMISV